MPADLYDVLGVPDDASAEELKRAYRGRVREYHPDQNDHPDGNKQFKLVRTANDVLSDPAERKTYDRLGHREYVEKHLDGLPPVSVFPDDAPPEGSTTADESENNGTTTDSKTTPATSTATDTTSAGSSGSRTSESGASDGPSSATKGRAGYESSGTESSSSERSTARQSSTEGSSSTERTADDTDSQAATAGADPSSWDAATNTTKSATADSSVSAGERRRRGLKRWYGVVAAALLLYLGGLGAYAFPRRSPLRAFVGDVVASPASALTGPLPLVPPSEYVLGAVRAATAGTPAIGLVLLAGTILLPLVVLTAIGQFGRGAAWLYALPSLAPAVCLAVWPVVAVPAVVALLGLVLLPVLSGGGFLVDVGRFLRATR